MVKRLTLKKIIVAIFALTLVLGLGCSDKGSGSGELVSSPLLKQLPDTTAGFFSFNLNNKGYLAYLNSPGYQSYWKLVLENAKQLPEMSFMQGYFEVLEPLGFFGPSVAEAPFSDALMFWTTNSGSSKDSATAIPFAYFLTAREGKSARQVFLKIKERLTAQKMPMVDQKIESVEAFQIELFSDPASAEVTNPVHALYRSFLQKQKVIFAANDQRLAIATTVPLAELAFKNGDGHFIDQMKAKSEFKEDLASLGEDMRTGNMFAYADIVKTFELLPAQYANIQQEFQSFAQPQTISMAGKVDSAMVARFSIRTLQIASMYQSWVNCFAVDGTHESLNKLPNGGAFGVSIAGQTIEKIKATAQPFLLAAPQSIKDQLNKIKISGDFAIAINAGAGLTIPEFQAVISGASPDLIEGIKTMAGTVPGGMLPPKETSVLGRKVIAMQSPLGVGAFATSEGDPLVIASSQAGLESTLNATTENNLLSTLPNSLKSMATKSKAAIVLAIDYGKLGSLFGNLAQAGGQSSEFMDAQMDAMKKFGVIILSFGFEDLYGKHYFKFEMGQAYMDS